mgnify:CR=1 FL=1
MALLNPKKNKLDLYKHNLKELLCEDKFGTPLFTTRAHITNIEAENDTGLSLSINEYFYMEPTFQVDGDILMENDIHYLKISGNKEAIVVDLKGGSKIIEDLTIISDNRLKVYCNASVEKLHLQGKHPHNAVGNVFIFPFSKDTFKDFNYRSLQGKCTGIYGVGWQYLEGISLNETYIKELEEHLIPILKDYPLLIGDYRLTLDNGNMKIEQIYQ